MTHDCALDLSFTGGGGERKRQHSVKKLALTGVAAAGIRMLTGSPWFWLAGISCIALLVFYVLAAQAYRTWLSVAGGTAGALI